MHESTPLAEMKRSTPAPSQRWWTLGFAIIFLGPSMIGFAIKFREFLHAFAFDPAGEFAIPPVMNYFLASLGFLSLLAWAAKNGMFHDLERPKFTMLEREQELDRDLSFPFDPDRSGPMEVTPVPTQAFVPPLERSHA